MKEQTLGTFPCGGPLSTAMAGAVSALVSDQEFMDNSFDWHNSC